MGTNTSRIVAFRFHSVGSGRWVIRDQLSCRLEFDAETVAWSLGLF